MLQVGMQAPDFTLEDQNGHSVSLSEFRGKKVVLYFYPKDMTPGCTKQACAFQQQRTAFEDAKIPVIGVSKDTVTAHQKFASKYGLSFLLLADPTTEVLQKYGVWQEKKLYGKVSMGTVRTTFLIDEEGRIEKIFEKVKPDVNATEILTYLGLAE